MVKQRKELEIIIKVRDEAEKELQRRQQKLRSLDKGLFTERQKLQRKQLDLSKSVGTYQHAQRRRRISEQKNLIALKQKERFELNQTLQGNRVELGQIQKNVKLRENAYRNARRFKMEYLSIMFGMMAIYRVISGFLKSAIQTYKIATENQGVFIKETNKLNAAWTFLKFRLIDALGQSDLFLKAIQFVIGLVDAIADLDDEELQKIGENLLLIAGLTGLATVAASMGLLAGGIKMLATDVIWKTVRALEGLTAAQLVTGFSTLVTNVGKFALKLFKWGIIIAIVGAVFKGFVEGLAGREITWGEVFGKMGDIFEGFGSLVYTTVGIIVESIAFALSLIGLLSTAAGETVSGAWAKITGTGDFDYSQTQKKLDELRTENWKNREGGWFKPEKGFQLDESGEGWGVAAHQELANIDLSNLEILKEASESAKSTIGSLQSSIGTSWLDDLDSTTVNLGDNVGIMSDDWKDWSDMMNFVLDRAGEAEAVLGSEKSLTPVIMLLTEKTTLAHQEFGMLNQALNSANTISFLLDGTMLMLNQTTITLTDSTNLEAEAHRNNAEAINEQAQAYYALTAAIRAYQSAKSSKYKSKGSS